MIKKCLKSVVIIFICVILSSVITGCTQKSISPTVEKMEEVEEKLKNKFDTEFSIEYDKDNQMICVSEFVNGLQAIVIDVKQYKNSTP